MGCIHSLSHQLLRCPRPILCFFRVQDCGCPSMLPVPQALGAEQVCTWTPSTHSLPTPFAGFPAVGCQFCLRLPGLRLYPGSPFAGTVVESHNKVEKKFFIIHVYCVCRDGSMYVIEHVEVREELWSWVSPSPFFVCPGYFSCCHDKHHNQKRMVEDRVDLADRSSSITGGSPAGTQDRK